MVKHIVVLDLSVAYHQMHDVLAQCQVKPSQWLNVVKAQLTWMMSTRWLGDLNGPVDQVILACDVKPYWRTEYLKDPYVLAGLRDRGTKAIKADSFELGELLEQKDLGNEIDEDRVTKLTESLTIHYKARRKFPAASFKKLRTTIRKLCKDKGWTMLQKSGYEADDWAAAIRMLNSSLEHPNHITLVTVDSDWMGLVDPHTTWFCMKGYAPRVREYQTPQFQEWCDRRLGCRVEEPADIWRVKRDQGDKSDNLPKGSPLEVISLLEPPSRYCLWDKPHDRAKLLDLLALSERPPMVDPTKSVDFLQRVGVPLFIGQY